MRLTVGPLPPAIYWRRRAAVLGSLLAVVILVAYSCSGSASDDPSRNASSQQAGSPGATPPEPTQAGEVSGGTTGDSTPPPAGITPSGGADQGQAPGGPAATGAAADPDLCADAEMLITPVPAAQEVPRGAPVRIILKIKNIGQRTCRRDVGADLQELYIKQQGSAQKVWSSDDCGGSRGTNVESFGPAFERSYTVDWNGRATTNCKEQPLPEPGEYQLFGRLGTKGSAPVSLTLT